MARPTSPPVAAVRPLAALAALLVPPLVVAAAPLADDATEFEPVRAVLERRCLECHGGQHRESALSFADGATFAAGGARGPVVDTDAPAASRLLAVVRYGDPDLAMPPSGPLPPDERAVLEAWVLDGAPWPDGAPGRLADPAAHPLHGQRASLDEPWWAYEALVAPDPPQLGAADAPDHPVDAFVAARLAEAGLEPARHAEPRALFRRAHFDLIGLPPDPAAVDGFLANVVAFGFDAAWAATIDELLDSPHHGEHFARRWLDLVRYGETNGYERDAAKTNVWRYRDWVVRAFDRDLPYDQFVLLQLAGDELAPTLAAPDARADALVATGYYRIGVWDDEPADPLQADADELADIVDTTAQVFMGTTLGCARCHDHKADPLTQREYFEFTANFAGLVGFGGGGYSQGQGGGATRDVASADTGGLATRADRDDELAAIDAELRTLSAELGEAAGAAPAVLVPDARAAGHRWRFREGEPEPGWASPAFDAGHWDEGPGGFGAPGTPGARVGTAWHSPRIQLRTTFRLDDVPTALRLTLHHDEDVEVFLNGQRVLAREGYRVDYGDFQLEADALAALVVGRNVLALDCRQTGGGQYVDAGLDTGSEVATDAGVRAALERALTGGAQGAAAERARGLLARRDALLAAPVRAAFPAQVAFERGPTPPEQFVQLRGSVHAPGDSVDPGVPAAWSLGSSPGAAAFAVEAPPADASSSGRRLALARWLTDGGAHLAARTEANRLWQALFGRGLCPTPGDFGRLGEEPVDAALLDHLASELIARQWSRRALLRYLMTSEAYRRATVGPAPSLAADPEDRLPWRMRPRRLTAEEFRDATLAVSGELVRTRFGPSVFPPLPAEVLATSSQPDNAWGTASAEDAVRRSLYVHVKRSLREPLLAAFDQPDPDLPCPARFPTNVPTQALLTLNGDFTRERAQAFAADLSARAGDPGARVELAYERAFARAPSADESARALDLLDRLGAEHGLDESRALALFCLGLFNRNEFFWLD